MTMILSAFRTVASLCAITSVVRSCISRSSASCTSFSDSATSADVASSSSSSGALRNTALAIDSRWRSEEYTSELQSLMRNTYDGFWLKKKNYKDSKQTKPAKNLK